MAGHRNYTEWKSPLLSFKTSSFDADARSWIHELWSLPKWAQNLEIVVFFINIKYEVYLPCSDCKEMKKLQIPSLKCCSFKLSSSVAHSYSEVVLDDKQYAILQMGDQVWGKHPSLQELLTLSTAPSVIICNLDIMLLKWKTKLHGLSPRANYRNRVTSACQRT
jgi:hypothetical protein